MTPKNISLILIGALAALALVLGSGSTSPAIAQGRSVQGPTIGTRVLPKQIAGDLRKLPLLTGKQGAVHLAPRHVARTGNSPDNATDPAIQYEVGASSMPAPNANFLGLGFGTTCLGGQCGSGWPPDTNGDVGPTYYVQAVNTAIGIFDKASGTRILAITFDALWAGANSGTMCDFNNQGDPVVLYDAAADRWLVTDFAFDYYSGGPYYECIAVSKTGDPVAGGWWLYPIWISDTVLNDYPKFGVWPDAYYMSANLFQGNYFQGVGVWAFDRQQLLNGAPVAPVSFQVSSQYGSLLPANLRGTPPPVGSPNYLLSIDAPSTNLLHLWRFHYDAANPPSSWFGTDSGNPNPLDIAVSKFVEPCVTAYSFTLRCIPQKNGERVDALGDRLMMQLQYRNINGVESLWASHTVGNSANAGWVSGIRWYEIRNPGGSPGVYQQSTYRPDSNYRWLPSLAVDKAGNMAIGYSVSSSAMYPAIRYAGRLASDPLNQLARGERSLVEGGGSQVGGYNRWGDYSAMTVDPVDDCTFWYTNEYYVATNDEWQTRIGAFRFPDCASGPRPTTIEDRDIRVSYDGWQGVADSQAGGGAYRVSSTPTNVARFSFTGSSVKWLCIKGPDMGSAQVLLDGISMGSVSLYAPATAAAVCKQVAPSTSLGNGSHVLKLISTGRVSIDAFQVGTTTYQEPNRNIQYNTWLGAAIVNASGGSLRYSSTAGGVAQLDFTGTAITWVTAKGPAYGRARVLIDSTDMGTVDLYSPVTEYEIPISYPGLAAGSHTIQILVLGTKSAAASGYRVAVDAFQVTP